MQLHDPVRVAKNAGSGSATVTLSFDNWKGAKVAPTTHNIVVLPAKPGPKVEAVASNFIGTLVHPDRKARIETVKFSADGKQLFTAVNPSGIVQIWDVAARKEFRRIDTPSGLHSATHFPSITPDLKLLYFPVSKLKHTKIEKDGRTIDRFGWSGEIRVWDASTGEERKPLKPPAGIGPFYAMLSPDGSALVCSEQLSFSVGENGPTSAIVVWNLKTGARRKLCDGAFHQHLSPDGKTVVVPVYDSDAKTSVLRLFDMATGKELASLKSPDKDRSFSVPSFSPDGSLLAVSPLGEDGSIPVKLFLDAKTLAERGRFVGVADPESNGWLDGTFAPDGKTYVIREADKVLIWDIAAKKVVRTINDVPNATPVTFAPDGKTFAVAWMPNGDVDLKQVRSPNPDDFPQPRITLFDLASDKPLRTLIAPHGMIGALAFSPDGKALAFGTTGGVRLFDLSK